LYFRSTLFALFIFLGGVSCVDTPTRAWRRYTRGAERPLPKSQGEATQRARVGETSLEREEGRWVLSSGVLDFYQTDTPRETLRTFVLAIENKRLDVLYRLLPKQDREDITEEEFIQNLPKTFIELEKTAENLKKHLDEPIRIIGNTAALFYQSGSVELLFEEDHWCILSAQ
jgi:hypothetical protein